MLEDGKKVQFLPQFCGTFSSITLDRGMISTNCFFPLLKWQRFFTFAIRGRPLKLKKEKNIFWWIFVESFVNQLLKKYFFQFFKIDTFQIILEKSTQIYFDIFSVLNSRFLPVFLIFFHNFCFKNDWVMECLFISWYKIDPF